MVIFHSYVTNYQRVYQFGDLSHQNPHDVKTVKAGPLTTQSTPEVFACPDSPKAATPRCIRHPTVARSERCQAGFCNMKLVRGRIICTNKDLFIYIYIIYIYKSNPKPLSFGEPYHVMFRLCFGGMNIQLTENVLPPAIIPCLRQ